MHLRAWFFAVLVVLATNDLAAAEGTATAEAQSVQPTAIETTATNPATAVATTTAAPTDKSPAAKGPAYTLWEFQLELKAFQHEPAGKSLDRIDTTLYFNALMPHDSSEVQQWSGYGMMTTKMISRAANSDQAPLRAVPQFSLQADTFWDRIGKALQIHLAPQDAVTYSLKSGPVLGTASILQLILPEATGPKLIGNLQTFALSTDTPVGATIVCSFDTMGKHVCWYEGSATLKVVGKREGVFPPQAEAQPAAAAATAEPKTKHKAAIDALSVR